MTSSESSDEWLSFTIDINFITRTSFARVGPFLLSQLVRPDHLCRTYVVRPDHLCTWTKYFVTEHKIIVKPCQSRDFPLSYAVIATIDHLFFHYFYCLDPYFILKFIIFNILVCLVFLLKHTASYKPMTVLLGQLLYQDTR